MSDIAEHSPQIPGEDTHQRNFPDSQIQDEASGRYEYTLPDGTVEVAKNEDEVYAKCKFLAQLAIINPTLATTIIQGTRRESPRALKEQEPKKEIPVIQAEAVNKNNLPAKEITSELKPVPLSVQPKPESSNSPSMTEIEPEETKTSIARDTKTHSINKREHDTFLSRQETERNQITIAAAEVVIEKSSIERATAPTSNNIQSIMNLVTPTKEISPNASDINVEEIAAHDVSTAPFETPITASEIAPKEPTETTSELVIDTIQHEDLDLFSPYEAPRDLHSFNAEGQDIDEIIFEASNANYDPVIVRLYHTLLAIDEFPEDTLEEKIEWDQLPLYQERLIYESDEESEIVVSRAQLFIESQPKPDQPPKLEHLIQHDESQPIEQTLALLALILNQESSKTDQTEQSSEEIQIERRIRTLLDTIETKMLFRNSGEEKLKNVEKFTPEIVALLMSLFTELGYENPELALSRFVTNYSIELLLQSIRYLYQLKRDENQYELQPKYSFAIMNFAQPDDSTTPRIGKALVRLFTQIHTTQRLAV